MRSRDISPYFWPPVVLALIAVVGWPMVAMVREATRPDTESGSKEIVAAARPGEIVRPIGLAFETVRLVIATEAIAMPIGLAMAFVLFRTDVWGRRVMLGLVVLSAFVPLPLHATGWLGGFGNLGRSQALGGGPLLVGWSGAAFVHAMASLPWIIAIAGVGFRSVEPDLEDSAKLDLSPWGVTWQVTIRRSLGAIAAAAMAVAVLTSGDMTVTDLLQVRTYAEECYTQYQRGNSPGAAAAAIPPFVALGGLVLVGARMLLRADPSRIASAMRARDWRLGRWRVPAGLLVAATAGNLVALPVYSLVWRAGRVGGMARAGMLPRWSVGGLLGTLGLACGELYGPGMDRPLRSPMLASAILSAAGATFAVSLAWSIAWLARKPGGWRWVAAVVVAVTLALPGPVAGMALVAAYVGWREVYDSPWAMVVIAYTLRTLPYAMLVLWPAVRSLPREYLDAAAVEGYGPWGQVRRVGIPMTLGAIAASWGVAFALAMGELPAANLVVPPGTTLLSVRVWELLHTGVESHLAGVGLVSLAVLGTSGMVAALGLGRAYGRRTDA